MRRGRVVVVTLVLLNAGCLGFEFGGPDSNQSAMTMPPGLGDGVTNASALVAAHERSLEGVGVVTETTVGENGTVAVAYNMSTVAPRSEFEASIRYDGEELVSHSGTVAE